MKEKLFYSILSEHTIIVQPVYIFRNALDFSHKCKHAVC